MDNNGGNNNPLLPPDLITSILVRLPVKSLIRFQCVCKEWRNLLKTQSFITQHLLHSSLQNPFLFLETGVVCRPYRAHLINSEMQIVGFHNHPFIGPDGYVTTKTHHCNGLLCLLLSDDDGNPSCSLWNPATRDMSLIFKDNHSYSLSNTVVGFGFSSIVNDYKVVKIFHYLDPNWVTEVEVYSLNVGAWKTVEHGKLDGVDISSHGLAFNGAIFWIGLKVAFMEGEHKRGVIVSFDVATEGFTLIPMPPMHFSTYDDEYGCRLAVYDNKLAILSHTLSQDIESCSIHLWVMEGEGASVSQERGCWTKKFTSNPYRGYFLHPVAIWKNEIVCNVYRLPIRVGQDGDEGETIAEPKIVMFNFTMNEFRAYDFPQFFHDYGSVVYAESLAQLGNIHIEHV